MQRIIKDFRFALRFSLVFCRKHYKLLIFSFVVGIVCFLLAPSLARLLIRKEERVGLVGKYTFTELPKDIQGYISQGLTQITEDCKVTPSLAESWEIVNSGKEYIFSIRKGVFWHDGTLVKASDIDYNFSDVTTAVLDDRKIKFALKEPFVPLPSILSRPVFKNGTIGTGEYVVKKIRRKGQIIESLTIVSENKTKPNMVFRFYPTEEAARNAFKLGEINVLREISKPQEFENWKNVKITPEVKQDRFVAIFLDTQDPKLADKSTRQAFAYAIKKRWEPRALNSFKPSCWAYNSTVKPYDQDTKNALKLLEKSNETDNSEVINEIELAAIPSLLEVAESIKKDWEEIGIKTKVKVLKSLDERSPALLLTQEIPADPDQYFLWHSTQEANISRYKSPKIDKLLEDGRKTFDQEKRKQIYFDFQKSLIEDTPAIFLYHPTLYTISRI